MLLHISLDAWIKEYSADPNAALVELANMLVQAAGLQKVHLDLGSVRGMGEDGDPLDELINEARCAELIEEAAQRKSYLEPYPLVDKKTGKKFKAGLNKVIEQLLEKIKHEILFDQVLLPWLVEWMTILSLSPHRGVRHTGVEVGMTMMCKLASLQVEVMSTKSAKERLAAGGAGKGGKKSSVTENLEKESKRLADQAQCIAEATQNIFDTVFLHRYRDSCDEMRVSCVSALGRCIEKLPGTYLHDTFLKYMGWLVYDPSAAVRGTAITRLVSIYKLNSGETAALTNFTTRFEDRFIEMIADTDKNVSIEAIKLATALKQAGMLDKERQAVRNALQLMSMTTDLQPALWKALAAFLQLHLHVKKNAADDAPDSPDKSGGGGAIAAGGISRLTNSPLVQLATLLRATPEDYDANAGTSEVPKAGEGSAGEDEKREKDLDDRCTRMVGAMKTMEPSLTDWPAYVELVRPSSNPSPPRRIRPSATYLP